MSGDKIPPIDPVTGKFITPSSGNKDWDFESTRKYFKENLPKAGDKVLVVSTQGGILDRQVGIVKAVTNRSIVLTKDYGWGGSSFYYNGKNCWSPKGKTRIIPIVERKIK
jgi:hypothetical protein